MIDLYFAGFGWSKSDIFILSEGKNRLLSYINDIKRIEKWMEVIRLIDLYLAGNTDGFERIRPEQIGLMFNLLLSYEYHKVKKNIDKLLPKKRLDREIRALIDNGINIDDIKIINVKEVIDGFIYGRT